MQIPGPDGFLISPDDPLRAAHLRLNDYLFSEEGRNTATTPFNVAPWRKLPKRELPGQTLSVLKRMRWLDEHDSELKDAHLARIRLVTLLRVLYKIKAPYTETDLIALLDDTSALLGRISPEEPVERVMEYLKTADLTPELCRALRNFQSSLKEEASGSQATLQSIRQCLHMLLWMDEWQPLDPSRCWSECIRRDFRAMTGERRTTWRALFKHLRGNAPVRMPAGWARDAQPLLAAVGIEDFRDKVEEWFAPFRSGEALPLSVAGSHVLKCMVWYCAVANDAGLKDCALWLLDSKWKRKREAEKSLVALAEFGVSREELTSRSLIKPQAPDPTPGFLRRLEKSLVMMPAALMVDDPDGKFLIVQGQLHFYRMFRPSGRIERATDKAVLELNWHSLPDQFRLILHPECDSEQQMRLRGFLLTNDSIFGRYFTVVH
jgi:hypothetical protein